MKRHEYVTLYVRIINYSLYSPTARLSKLCGIFVYNVLQVRMRWKPPTTVFARLATSLGWCSYLAPAVHECSVISQDYRTSITKVFMTLFLKKGGAIAPLAPPGYATAMYIQSSHPTLSSTHSPHTRTSH